MKFNALHIVLVFLFLPFSFISQSKIDKTEIIEERIDFIGSENEDIDYTALFDNLFYYLDNPINLNHVSELNNLVELGLLTSIQINYLKTHIQNNNKLMSIYELQAVENFDMQVIRRILPFVKVNARLETPNVSLSQIWKNSKNEIYIRNIRDLEERLGYSAKIDSNDKRYLGSPDKLFFRYRFKYLNKISIGITAEKDQGEEFFKGAQKNGFDYYSAHFFMKDFGKIKRLAIGDYHFQSGQGLTFWSGLAFGKSIDIKSINRNAPGVRHYASADENNFLRGGAITYEITKKIEATAFYSSKFVDANVADTLSETKEITFSSLQNTGFHRTESELNNKDAVKETHIGGKLQFKNKNLKIGATGFFTKYGGDYNRKLKYYNQFELNSNRNSVIGMDYNYVYKNYYFFGEVARSQNGAIANIHGLLFSLDPRFSVTTFYRNYPKNYQNSMANSIGESSKPVNEKGIYIGAEAKLPYRLTLTGAIDFFKFPWMKYRTVKPNSIGYEMVTQLSYRPSRNFKVYFRVKKEEKELNYSDPNKNINSIANETKTNYRLNLSYKISDNFTLRNRVEIVYFKKENKDTENGFLAYQDVIYKPKSKSYSFTARYALFDSKSFNSRIYAYENDVLYYFYIPAYYRVGSRFYLTARYKYRKKFDFWVRYGIWKYRNQESLFSGLEEIKGNTKSDVKVVFRYLF